MKNLLLLASLCFLLACDSGDSSDYAISNQETVITPMPMPTGVLLSEDDATNILHDFIGSFNDTKSASANVRIVNCKKRSVLDYANSNSLKALKSQMADTTETIKNIPIYEFTTSSEDGKYGFALVPGNSLLGEVIAYSPEGSLADTIFNDGLKLFMMSIPNMLYSAFNENNQSKKVTKSDYIQPDGTYAHMIFEQDSEVVLRTVYSSDECMAWYNSIDKVGNWDQFETQSRFISVKWDQEAPYNNLVEVFCGGKRVKVGCTPVAMAQIMAYHRKPTTYNWNLLTAQQKIALNATNGSAQEVARLMINVAKTFNTSHNCEENTGIGAGSTSWVNTVNGIEKLGYKYNYVENFDLEPSSPILDTIYNNIINNRPLIINGITKIYNSDGTFKNAGHTWIIDGIYKKWRDYYYYYSTSGYGIPQRYWSLCKCRQRSTLIHYCWGWGGSSDGWYRTTTPINEGYNFQKWELFTQIRPQ